MSDGGGFSGVASSMGADPHHDDHANPVGDVVVRGVVALARRLGPVGRPVVERLAPARRP